jgi:hypothetical protein
MFWKRFALMCGLVAALAWAPGGCTTKTANDSKKSADKTEPKKPADKAESDVVVLSKIVDGEAEKLSDQDQKLAEKQATCPVTDAKLGSMGAPVKVKVKGRIMFLCCEGCLPSLEKEPDKYLAKLDAAKK